MKGFFVYFAICRARSIWINLGRSVSGGESGTYWDYIWRRERDSNPRYPLRYNGFQDRRYQPLTHPSACRWNRLHSILRRIAMILETEVLFEWWKFPVFRRFPAICSASVRVVFSAGKKRRGGPGAVCGPSRWWKCCKPVLRCRMNLSTLSYKCFRWAEVCRRWFRSTYRSWCLWSH